MTRAWEIDAAEWQDVEEIFPQAYGSAAVQAIGANGVKVASEEAARLASMTVHEVPVYRQTGKIDGSIRPFEDALKPSRAVIIVKEPCYVGEVDGPKHLYILKLEGGEQESLGRSLDSSLE